MDLVDVQLGAEQINWTEIDTDEESDQQYRLTFPKPLSERRVLVVRAVASLKPDRAWRLPRIRSADTVLLEGSASLVVSQPLLLADLQIDQGAQSSVETLPDARAGESLQFQYYDPKSNIDVVIRNQSANLHVESATLIELDEQKFNARYVIDATSTNGPIYSINGELGEGWQISTVNSEPAGLLHWQVDGRKLSIWLQRGLTNDAPLRVEVTAVKGRSPLGQKLLPDDLRVLRFDGVAGRRDVIHLTASRALRLSTSQKATAKLTDMSVLTPEDLSRLGEYGSTGLWWIDDPLNEFATVEVERRSPEYAANNQVVIQVKQDSLAYSYRVDCRPQSRGVDRLIVVISAGMWSPSGGR